MNDVPYFYDHEGRRIQVGESINAVHYLWDEFSTYGDVILESNYDYDYSRHYTLANGMLLSHSQIIANQSVPSYYLSDAQGSTRALANLSGTITDSYTYDAFGTLSEHLNLGIGGNLVPNEDGIFGTHYLYTGQQFDPYTELYSLRARYYDTSIGRFLSRDTWTYNYENPVELNRYVFTGNNPITHIDPSGNSFLQTTLLKAKVFLAARGGTMLTGGLVGGMIGAVVGGLHAAIRYGLTEIDACGNRTNQGSLTSAVLGGIIQGAAFGAAVGVGAGAGPLGKVITGTILTAIGFGGFVGAGYELSTDIMSGEGFNVCAAADAALSFLAMYFGTNMIADGVAQAAAEALGKIINGESSGTQAPPPIITSNRAQGARGEAYVRDLLERAGLEYYEQVRVSIRTDGFGPSEIRATTDYRIVDFLVRTNSGRWIGFEVKTGGATRSLSQRMWDNYILNFGGYVSNPNVQSVLGSTHIRPFSIHELSIPTADIP